MIAGDVSKMFVSWAFFAGMLTCALVGRLLGTAKTGSPTANTLLLPSSSVGHGSFDLNKQIKAFVRYGDFMSIFSQVAVKVGHGALYARV